MRRILYCCRELSYVRPTCLQNDTDAIFGGRMHNDASDSRGSLRTRRGSLRTLGGLFELEGASSDLKGALRTREGFFGLAGTFSDSRWPLRTRQGLFGPKRVSSDSRGPLRTRRQTSQQGGVPNTIDRKLYLGCCLRFFSSLFFLFFQARTIIWYFFR